MTFLLPLYVATAQHVTESVVREANADGIELKYVLEKRYYTDSDGTIIGDTIYTCTLTRADDYRYDIVGTLRIPERVHGYNVNNIGISAFEDCVYMTAVEFPSHLEYIRNYAFQGCTKLGSVTFPEGLKVIGLDAFAGCTAIESVTFPGTLTSVGNSAFLDCSSLREVKGLDLSIDIGKNAFAGCYALQAFDVSSARGRFPAIFRKNKNITSITIPEGVTSLDESAFQGCTNLKSITLPTTLTGTGHYVFDGCSSLERVEGFSLSLHMGQYAFRGCTSLKSLDFGEAGEIIWDRTFQGWPGMETVVIPEGVKIICAGAFWGLNLMRSLILPNTLKYIREDGFRFCSSLEEVVVPNSVEDPGNAFQDCTGLKRATTPVLGGEMFAGCTQLEEVSLTGRPTSVPAFAFYNCQSLKAVELPPTVKTIGVSAFCDCKSLEAMTVPESGRAIMKTAFEGCSSLREISLPKGLLEMGENVFDGCTGLRAVYSHVAEPFTIPASCFPSEVKGVATLYVPAGTRSLYEATPGWNFTSIVEMDVEQGIDDVQDGMGTAVNDGCAFDLQGRRIEPSAFNSQSATRRKGISIRNGKKVVSK